MLLFTVNYFVCLSGCRRIVPSNFSSCIGDGKFYGAQSFPGLVTQQFQFGRTQI